MSWSWTDLCRIWRKKVRTFIPWYVGYRRYRVRNFCLLLVGIFKARHIYLSYVARKIPIRVDKLSLTRRFRRFLDNAAIDVRKWYRPTMKALLQSAAQSGHIRLIIDCTTVGRRYLMMSVAVAYRRRALPIAWSWVPIPNGNGRSTEAAQIKLLNYVRGHLPADAVISLVGDTEFGGSKLIKALERWRWGYALHQKENTKFFRKRFYEFQEIPIAPGQQVWFEGVELFISQLVMTNILIYQGKEHKEPLYIATNFANAKIALAAYKRRMGIEEMFAHFKQHGFYLWHSRLATEERLSRLTLLVCLLYLWLISIGQHVVDEGLASEVDRSDRRDLSIFRLGWDWLERRCILGDPIPPISVSYISFLPDPSLADL